MLYHAFCYQLHDSFNITVKRLYCERLQVHHSIGILRLLNHLLSLSISNVSRVFIIKTQQKKNIPRFVDKREHEAQNFLFRKVWQHRGNSLRFLFHAETIEENCSTLYTNYYVPLDFVAEETDLSSSCLVLFAPATSE